MPAGGAVVAQLGPRPGDESVAGDDGGEQV
jgi:hypothetical protein